MEKKEWHTFDEKDLLEEEDKENEGPFYVSQCTNNGTELSLVEKKERFMFMRDEHDLNPMIYYRLTRPLKKDKKLPTFELNDYYKDSKYKGLNIEITPDYTYCLNPSIVEKTKEQHTELYDLVKKFPKSCDAELKEKIEKYMGDNSINLEDNDDYNLKLSDLEAFKNKKLKNLQEK